MTLAHELHRRFTYADYLRWPEDERWELIDGEPWNMSPAPTLAHQAVSMRLSLLLGNHFRERRCQVFAAPVDVALAAAEAADDEIDTVVQPDLVVVCDPNKLRGSHVRGAPDLVVEIVSPTSVRRDERIKRDRYQRAGVQEYWIVHPEDHVVHRYTAVDGRFGVPDVFGPEDGTFPSSRFPELAVDLPQLFDVEPPPPQAPPVPVG
jgi:Uma2 family endonuclease